MGAFVYTAMVNYATAANFMAPLPGYPVEQVRELIILCQNCLYQVNLLTSLALQSDVQDHRRVP